MIKLVCAAGALTFFLAPTSAAAGVNVDPAKLSPRLFIEAERNVPPSASQPENSGQVGEGQLTYQPIVACRVDDVLAIYGCRDVDADPDDPDSPELTEGDILTAVREIGLPSLEVQIQPGEETLVNIPTIFYARPEPFERSVELLGFDIDLVAEPVSYRWVHGDGTSRSTTRPGKPYPAMDVTHRYRDPADQVRARVDVTYQVRYRIDDGTWQTLSQTLLASGPATGLDVKEAAPVLTTPGPNF